MATDGELEPTRLEGADLGRSDPPDRVDNYRLLQRVGEGGMGEVYQAEQEQPFRRIVALKLIKPGMDSKQVIGRFESERQALALMNNPYIAKVFDAGQTEQGRPYFVMEYVEGIPIDSYCDRNRLSTKERLRLFVQVCDGVQHAHQKGIIHRDIKPSNVLVTTQDGKPTAKIIDFGIAKAIAQRLTARTAFTELGQFIGTPEYMSPEQAEMTGLDVDTRTDVYSLGVLLYELLVGSVPFEVSKIGFDEARRQIRDELPQKPSTRAGTKNETARLAARNRATDEVSLSKRLRGDLDWISMKALEKDRTRRYASVSELAVDIERHLNHQPVLAGPPSAMYALGKYVRRHKTAVGFAAAMVALLAGFAVTMALQAQRTARERDRANREAAAAREMASFLEGLFEVADPSEARGSTITAREILAEGADKIDRGLENQPLVQARLMGTMGRVYRSLGLYGEARPLLERALAILRAEPGAEPVDRVQALNSLARVFLVEEDHEAARALYEHARGLGEAELGPDHPELGHSLQGLANVRKYAGEYDRALSLYERTLSIWTAALGPDHPELARTLEGIATVHLKRGEYDKARPRYERALEIRERALGPDHPAMAESLVYLGNLYKNAGEHERARPLFQRAVAIYEHTLDPDHPRLAEGLYALANVYVEGKDYARARPLLERCLGIREKIFPPDSLPLARTVNSVAAVHFLVRDYAAARPLYERALESMEAVLGGNHIDVADPLRNLGLLLMMTGDLAAARPRLERALEIRRTHLESGAPDVADSLSDLGRLHYGLQDYGKARDYFEQELEIRADADHPTAADSAYNLACVSALAGDRESALAYLRQAVDRGHRGDAIARERDFDSLRGDPGFEAIVAELTRPGGD